MADRFSTTIADNDWFLLNFTEAPGDSSTINLTRAVSGLSRLQAYAIRNTRSSTYVEDPYVDGVAWTGTWKVKENGIRPVNEGTDSGSFMFYETIQFGSYSSCVDENEIFGRAGSEPYEQNEYNWMFYEWQRLDEAKSWYGIHKDYISYVQGYMNQIHKTSGSGLTMTLGTYLDAGTDNNYVGIGNIVIYAVNDGSFTFEAGRAAGGGWNTVELQNGVKVYQDTFRANLTAGKYYLFSVTRNGTTDDCYGFPETCGHGEYPIYSLTLTELTQPQISRCYTEEANDGTYRLHRSLRSFSSDYFLKTRGFKYAGLVTVYGTPILDDAEITLTGFLDDTDLIHKHARFQIGGDVYRVTADATVGEITVDEATFTGVTLAITPTITQATEDLCDEYTNQVMATFLAMR